MTSRFPWKAIVHPDPYSVTWHHSGCFVFRTEVPAVMRVRWLLSDSEMPQPGICNCGPMVDLYLATGRIPD